MIKLRSFIKEKKEITSKEFIYNLAVDLGLKSQTNYLSDDYVSKLMKFRKDGYFYTFVISDSSTTIGIWRFVYDDYSIADVHRDGKQYKSRLAVDLCNPKSIDKIKDFVL